MWQSTLHEEKVRRCLSTNTKAFYVQFSEYTSLFTGYCNEHAFILELNCNELFLLTFSFSDVAMNCIHYETEL